MKSVKRTAIIVRRAITIPYNRRNSDYNPEFLDKDVLLTKYKPLIQSLHRYFCSYVGVMEQPFDVDDLFSFIQLEFLNLAQRYDPKRGVDFSGYIKMNLRHRVYYYVTKVQKRQNSEQLARQYGDEPTNMDVVPYDQPDESAGEALNMVEAMASIPWGILSLFQKDLIQEIIHEHQTLEQVSRNHSMSYRIVKEEFENLCNLLIEVNNPVEETLESEDDETECDEFQ